MGTCGIGGLRVRGEITPNIRLGLRGRIGCGIGCVSSIGGYINVLNFHVASTGLGPFRIGVRVTTRFSFNRRSRGTSVRARSFSRLFPFLEVIVGGVASLANVPKLVVPVVELGGSGMVINGPRRTRGDPLGWMGYIVSISLVFGLVCG